MSLSIGLPLSSAASGGFHAQSPSRSGKNRVPFEARRASQGNLT